MQIIERGRVKGKGGKPKVRIGFRLSGAEDKMVRVQAREAGLTVSAYLGTLIRKYAEEDAPSQEGNKK